MANAQLTGRKNVLNKVQKSGGRAEARTHKVRQKSMSTPVCYWESKIDDGHERWRRETSSPQAIDLSFNSNLQVK